MAKYQEKPEIIDFCDAEEDGGAVHRCLHAIMHLIEDHAKQARIPVRFAAAKLAEGDGLILEKLNLDQNEKEMLEHIVKQMETERGLDRSAAIAHMRFDFIERVCEETVVKPRESKEHVRSTKIDSVLTGKYTAIPCFVGNHGAGFLADFRSDRRVSFGYSGHGDHRTRRSGRFLDDGGQCKYSASTAW